MHVGRRFSVPEVLLWTRREIYVFAVVAAVPTFLYALGMEMLAIPWLPVSLVGIAVAFLVGFKNNATYDRLWEARKIWGAIVNDSRTWGIMSRDFVTNRHADTPLDDEALAAVHRELVDRHLAWLTALRFQLRTARAWEYFDRDYNREYREAAYTVPEHESDLGTELAAFLSEEEHALVMAKKNRATQIIAEQSRRLRELLDQGLIEDFRHMELEALLQAFYTHQGKCERIKNFPYPRQFATLNNLFVWIFIGLLPLGLLKSFSESGWLILNIPFTVLVAWIFHTMEKIGEATENPFEGAANDIPMAALARTIEIDMLEMLDETDLPEPLRPINHILM